MVEFRLQCLVIYWIFTIGLFLGFSGLASINVLNVRCSGQFLVSVARFGSV